MPQNFRIMSKMRESGMENISDFSVFVAGDNETNVDILVDALPAKTPVPRCGF